MTRLKKVLGIILVSVMLLTVAACGDGSPAVYDAPEGAPYDGLYFIDKMNSNFSYSYKKGVYNFKITMKWKTEDENYVSAEFSDFYYLEWAMDNVSPYSLVEPVNDMIKLKNNKYIIKPGEDVTVYPDVDSYFDGLPKGIYRFVYVYDVTFQDGSKDQRVNYFEFDMTE